MRAWALVLRRLLARLPFQPAFLHPLILTHSLTHSLLPLARSYKPTGLGDSTPAMDLGYLMKDVLGSMYPLDFDAVMNRCAPFYHPVLWAVWYIKFRDAMTDVLGSMCPLDFDAVMNRCTFVCEYLCWLFSLLCAAQRCHA